MNMAYIAGANALAPSAPMLLLETFKMDIAPLSLLSWSQVFVLDVKIVTYLCSSQADRIIAPDTIKYFPEQSSSVMPVSTVTGWLFRSPNSFPRSPLNVSLDNAPLALLAHCGCPNFQMSKFKLYMKAGRISNLIINWIRLTLLGPVL